MATSNRSLKLAYNKWNAEYFEGKLPPVQVLWEPVNDGIAEFDPNGPVIRLDPSLRFSRSMWSMALLHELCHVKLAPRVSHGKRFQDEMKRLALMDAFKRWW